MRPYLIIAMVLVIVVSFASKMLFFPSPAAEAQSSAATAANIDVLQMHLDHPTIRHLPEQSVKEPF
jgi:flagellar basal body-associated protein FliL